MNGGMRIVEDERGRGLIIGGRVEWDVLVTLTFAHQVPFFDNTCFDGLVKGNVDIPESFFLLGQRSCSLVRV